MRISTGHVTTLQGSDRRIVIQVLDATEWRDFSKAQGLSEGILAPRGIQLDVEDGSARCVVDGTLSSHLLEGEVAHEIGHAIGYIHPLGYGLRVRLAQILHAASIGFGTMSAGWPLRIRDPEGLRPMAQVFLGSLV